MAVAAAAGCGGVDKTQPCMNIQQEIQSLLQIGINQVNDPPALATTLRESATKIRNEGEPVGGDVEQAADEAGTALERLAERLGEDGEPQQSDLDPLLKAGADIRAACA
ncbi:MAG: hypothetical protein ACRDTC_28505 [Pseudonocardiaceae bacterium]